MTSTCIKITDTIASIALGLLFMFTAPAVTRAATNCPPLVSRVLVTIDQIQTTSTAYVNVTGTSVKFTQGGNKAACVLVLFSANAGAAAGENMRVRARVDNSVVCEPNNSYFVASGTNPPGSTNHAMSFLCAGVAPGNHSVKMQYASNTGALVYLQARMMTVQYVP